MVNHASFCLGAIDIIRQAELTDVRGIWRVAEAAYQPYIVRIRRQPAPMVADFEKHIARDWVIVFEQNGVLGYAIIIIDQGSALLDNIAVDRSSQRRGIGNALINHVELHLQRLGYSEYKLYTNAAMVENVLWYRRLGFAETRQVKEQGFDRIYMRKFLSLTCKSQ